MKEAKELILATMREAISERDPRLLDQAAGMAKMAQLLNALTINDLVNLNHSIVSCELFCEGEDAERTTEEYRNEGRGVYAQKSLRGS